MVREPPPTTLLRGRTEPEVEGRVEEVTPLLFAEVAVCVPPVGFTADEGLPLVEGFALFVSLDGEPPEEGLDPEDGFAVVDGELADGVDGLSDVGGTLACATGAPPLNRL